MGNESLPRRLHGLISPFSLFWRKIGRFLALFVEKKFVEKYVEFRWGDLVCGWGDLGCRIHLSERTYAIKTPEEG